ncbi:MAG: 16S rRNA (uracil(1498)-N(3))-methyltransferase [Paraprevotella sp.]|nr:16S rRNA (uracil(1498)-N(3))-methyltransferase [Paraprevotella sp.]
MHFFYAPDVGHTSELPPDEAAHCLRVLRLQTGDEIRLTDGAGHLYRAEIVSTAGKRCAFRILEETERQPEWNGHLHLAVAPTKNIDRMEWLAEKATEIGFDELTFLDCDYSERKVVKTERIEKILVAAMKQSHKAFKPLCHGMEHFGHFVARDFTGQKFIAHCYDEADIRGEAKADEDKTMESGKPFLFDQLDPCADAVVMVGPEGDFSVDEVRKALSCGFRSVSLGRSRLRTETAALVAVHLMHIKHAR